MMRLGNRLAWREEILVPGICEVMRPELELWRMGKGEEGVKKR